MIELSIVVPSRDSGPRLGALLRALDAGAGTAPPFEVVVVDDGSRVPVPDDVGAPFAGLKVRVVQRARSGGIAVARNAGWQTAQGRICLFLDDDIAPDPTLVAHHVRAHPPGSRRIGIGRLTTRVADDADWLARRFADAWNRHVAALDGGRPLRPDDAYGGNLSVPTELLRASDGFDEGLPRSEDAELAMRLVAGGAELVYGLAWADYLRLEPATWLLHAASEMRRRADDGDPQGVEVDGLFARMAVAALERAEAIPPRG